MTNKHSPDGSPFTFALAMVGGCVVLYLLATSAKKTPIGTISGLPPYQGPGTPQPSRSFG